MTAPIYLIFMGKLADCKRIKIQCKKPVRLFDIKAKESGIRVMGRFFLNSALFDKIENLFNIPCM